MSSLHRKLRELLSERPNPEDTISSLEAQALLDGNPEPDDGLRYSDTVRGDRGGETPDGWDEKQWHRDAMSDSGTSHSLHGRLYVVQCQWCPKAFAGTTKAEAMILFRDHENEMQETEMTAAHGNEVTS